MQSRASAEVPVWSGQTESRLRQGRGRHFRDFSCPKCSRGRFFRQRRRISTIAPHLCRLLHLSRSSRSSKKSGSFRHRLLKEDAANSENQLAAVVQSRTAFRDLPEEKTEKEKIQSGFFRITFGLALGLTKPDDGGNVEPVHGTWSEVGISCAANQH